MQIIAILLSKSAKSRVGEQQTELISYYIQIQKLAIQCTRVLTRVLLEGEKL